MLSQSAQVKTPLIPNSEKRLSFTNHNLLFAALLIFAFCAGGKIFSSHLHQLTSSQEDAIAMQGDAPSGDGATPWMFDIFLIRHGQSLANEVVRLKKENGVIQMLDGTNVPASDFYNGCNSGKLPQGVTQRDCEEFLMDSKLSDQGLHDAQELANNFDKWARTSQGDATGSPEIYSKSDAQLVLSPLRRSAVTGMIPFKDAFSHIPIEVDFDFRELQYTIAGGLHPENQILNYHQALEEYFAQLDLHPPKETIREIIHPMVFKIGINYAMDQYSPGHLPETFEGDGCPKDPEFFQKAIQRAAINAGNNGKKYIVISSHAYAIKCMNREFCRQQSPNGKPDESNPFFEYGWHVIANGAVERITWDMKRKVVIGGPTQVHKGFHTYNDDIMGRWNDFNSQWPKPSVPQAASASSSNQPSV